MTPADQRAADRERQRRRRKRQRDKVAVFHVEAGIDELNFLVRTLWLRDGDVDDPQKVGDAISRALADAAAK